MDCFYNYFDDFVGCLNTPQYGVRRANHGWRMRVETFPKGASNSQLQDVNGRVKPLSEYPNWLFHPSAINIARFHFQFVSDWEAS